MKVIVCGGRDFNQKEFLFKVLDIVHQTNPITELSHGGARGADALSSEWAKENNVNTREFLAEWRTHGKAARMIRNQLMLDQVKPDLVIAFAGGRGTNDMKTRSRAKGYVVFNVDEV